MESMIYSYKMLQASETTYVSVVASSIDSIYFYRNKKL